MYVVWCVLLGWHTIVSMPMHAIWMLHRVSVSTFSFVIDAHQLTSNNNVIVHTIAVAGELDDAEHVAARGIAIGAAADAAGQCFNKLHCAVHPSHDHDAKPDGSRVRLASCICTAHGFGHVREE